VPDPSLLRTHPETADRIERLLALVPRPSRSGLPLAEDASVPGVGMPQPGRPRYRLPGIWY